MRIKRIEVIGFKSFCDRAVMTFDQPITAVVGPNGCGKSNIVDAIRWCMGEQSAKHLRGKAMDDVIFAGSESRGPASMAEVSLTFEDVGFSHETLELELGQQEQLEAIDVANGEGTAESPGDAAEPEVAGPQAASDDRDATEASGADETVSEDGWPIAGETVPESAASGEPIEGESVPPGPSATEEVAEFLADRPPTIDFREYTEVTITRRLFRDGTSLYMINKIPCRLRDVRDFFLGTGVGTKAYSIIEQGRIGMIVSARPQDRRSLIEEAAGITKFREKKRAAERKLEKTRQNLVRVFDIVTELEKRMGSLKRQAQKAKRYRRYRAEVRDIDLWRASHQFLEIRAEDRIVRIQRDRLTEDLQVSRANLDKEDTAVVAERAELSVQERELAGLQEELYDLENRLKLTESKIDFESREAAQLDERVTASSNEIETLLRKRDDNASELTARSGELEQLDGHMETHQKGATDLDAAAAEARQRLDASRTELESARGVLSQARTELARADSQKESLDRREQDGKRRLARVIEEAAESAKRIKQYSSRLKELDRDLAKLRQTKLDLTSRTETLERRQGELEAQTKTGEAEVETLRTEVHRRKSRLQSLREIHDKYEGFARGTRAVMQHSSELAQGENARIFGVVADVVRAPEQLEAAVEAALGDQLGGIVVDSHAVGVKAIEYLKAESAGRSSFVPSGRVALEAVAAGIEVEDRSWSQDVSTEGIVGNMVDLVEFESGFDKLGKSLLGSTVVVDNLKRGLELHSSGVDKTLVTLDGDVVRPTGVVSGGSSDDQKASVLAQKREIRDLEEITEGLERDLADATARYVAAKAELVQVSRTLDALRNEGHDGDIAITGGEKDLERCSAELDRARRRAVELNTEQLELEERLEQVTREKHELVALVASATERRDESERAQLQLIDGVNEAQADVERLTKDVTEARVRLAQLGEKRASLHAAKLSLELAERELADRIEKLTSTVEDSGKRAQQLREECAQLKEALAELRSQHRERADALAEGRTNYELRVAELQVAEVAVRELRAKVEKYAGELSNAELKLSNLEMSRRVLQDGIAERYQLELSRELGDYHLRPQVGEEQEKRLEELRRLIDRMGADINLTAIDEYQDVAKRHDFLSGQRTDLSNAVDQLEAAIGKINRTSRKMFRDTFDAINAQFQDVFPRLFRGGRARLSLKTAEGQDILESGVDIFAQPPGKKNTTVEQLSGGEKALTAVALIFGIFLIKPSPFCLLDEVDAPLDDVNVDRYNEIVREMTDRSQFIVITHNKRTMEIANRLYGVTMQEPGVSKLVSVNLASLNGSEAA